MSCTASNQPRSRRARSRARRRRSASEQPTGPPSGAPGALQRPLRRSSAAIGARRRPGSSAARAGARRRVGAADAHGVVGRSLGGALALVPVWGARREMATVRAPRRLGGGFRRVRAGMGVLGGCPRAGQGGAGASQVPLRCGRCRMPRVNMCAHAMFVISEIRTRLHLR